MLRPPKLSALVPDSLDSLLSLVAFGLFVRSLFKGLSQIIWLTVSEVVLFPAVLVEHVLLFELDRCLVKLEDRASSSIIPPIVLFLAVFYPW